jgi:hypothetical protein
MKLLAGDSLIRICVLLTTGRGVDCCVIYWGLCIIERGGKRTREGVNNGIGRLKRMKHGSGMKGRDDRSIGIEILMTDAFTKIKPTDLVSDPLRLDKQAVRRKRN